MARDTSRSFWIDVAAGLTVIILSAVAFTAVRYERFMASGKRFSLSDHQVYAAEQHTAHIEIKSLIQSNAEAITRILDKLDQLPPRTIEENRRRLDRLEFEVFDNGPDISNLLLDGEDWPQGG